MYVKSNNAVLLQKLADVLMYICLKGPTHQVRNAQSKIMISPDLGHVTPDTPDIK